MLRQTSFVKVKSRVKLLGQTNQLFRQPPTHVGPAIDHEVEDRISCHLQALWLLRIPTCWFKVQRM